MTLPEIAASAHEQAKANEHIAELKALKERLMQEKMLAGSDGQMAGPLIGKCKEKESRAYDLKDGLEPEVEAMRIIYGQLTVLTTAFISSMRTLAPKMLAVCRAAKQGPCRHDSSHAGMDTCEVCSALSALEAP